jgi:hypothetical protein
MSSAGSKASSSASMKPMKGRHDLRAIVVGKGVPFP